MQGEAATEDVPDLAHELTELLLVLLVLHDERVQSRREDRLQHCHEFHLLDLDEPPDGSHRLVYPLLLLDRLEEVGDLLSVREERTPLRLARRRHTVLLHLDLTRDVRESVLLRPQLVAMGVLLLLGVLSFVSRPDGLRCELGELVLHVGHPQLDCCAFGVDVAVELDALGGELLVKVGDGRLKGLDLGCSRAIDVLHTLSSSVVHIVSLGGRNEDVRRNP